MIETKVARRYAKSLIDLSRETGAIEAVGADMQLFVAVCEQNRDLTNSNAKNQAQVILILKQGICVHVTRPLDSGKLDTRTRAWRGKMITYRYDEVPHRCTSNAFLRLELPDRMWRD